MIRIFSIRNGPAGTRQTLTAMVKLAREGASLPYVLMLGRMYQPIDYENLVRSNWRFAEELDETLTPVETQAESYLTHNFMMGDCDDAAIVVGAVAAASDQKARFVAVRQGQEDQFTHVFVEVLASGGKWLRVDPTAPLDAHYDGWERMEQNI